MAGSLQLFNNFLVNVTALRLTGRLVWATDLHTFVPVQTQPTEGIQDHVERFFAVALGIGVFNAEDELSTGVTSVGPVKESGTHQTNVRKTGW